MADVDEIGDSGANYNTLLHYKKLKKMSVINGWGCTLDPKNEEDKQIIDELFWEQTSLINDSKVNKDAALREFNRVVGLLNQRNAEDVQYHSNTERIRVTVNGQNFFFTQREATEFIDYYQQLNKISTLWPSVQP